MGSTNYIVMEREFQYNDEYFYVDSDVGGIPTKVFNNQAEADQEAVRLCLDWFRGQNIHNLSSYCNNSDYDGELDTKISKLCNKLWKDRLEAAYEWSRDKSAIPKSATDDEIRKLWNVMSSHMAIPYFVMKVD